MKPPFTTREAYHLAKLFPKLNPVADRGMVELKTARLTSTASLIEWLTREEQRKVRDEIRALAEPMPSLIAARLVLLRLISPLPHREGSVMELHVRLLEAAVSLIDWEEIGLALENFHD